MHHDHDERMQVYARRTADELLKHLHSRPAESQEETQCRQSENGLNK
jgi:hypothetical protein